MTKEVPSKERQVSAAKMLIENLNIDITIDHDIVSLAQIILGGNNSIGMVALQGAVKIAYSNMNVKEVLTNQIIENMQIGFTDQDKLNF